jgi:uncharacterized protein (UPF0261 family)
MQKTILVIATLDTKAAEAGYIKELLQKKGQKAIVMDIGIVGETPLKPDISSAEVAGACKVKVGELVSSQRRDLSMKAMGEGAAKICRELCDKGKIDGVIGIGGNQGTMIATFAMKTLPFGFPKVMVSTVASGNIRPYVGHKDIAMIFSVADMLGGINVVTKTILSNATGAVLGMCETGVKMPASYGSKTIGITAFGSTHAAASTALGLLKNMGYEVVVFHSSGAGGSALEELIAQGVISGVLDFTPHELVAEIFPEAYDVYAPVNPGKLEAAVRKGIPLAVAPGGLDYFVYGPASTVPLQYRDRKIHYHNPNNVNVRVNKDELEITGRIMAERLNKAKGPVAVLIPLQGWTNWDKKGGDLYDEVADRAFVESLKKHASSRIRIIEIDCHINDPVFAKTAVDILDKMMKTHRL